MKFWQSILPIYFQISNMLGQKKKEMQKKKLNHLCQKERERERERLGSAI